MKLLQAHIEFKLSDSFEGTFSDALREMAEYCESPEADARETKDGVLIDDLRTAKAWQHEAYVMLLDLNKKDGTRSIFSEFHGEWPKKEVDVGIAVL